MSRHVEDAVKEYFADKIPPYVQAMASAVKYDLMHGPAYAEIPENGIENFTVDDYASFPEDLNDPEKAVLVFDDLYNHFTKWLDDNFPSEIYVDDLGYASENEPTGYYLDADGEETSDSEHEDEEGDIVSNEYVEPGEYWAVDAKNIANILWGKAVATQLY